MNQAEGSGAPLIGESSIEKLDHFRIDFDPNDAGRTFEQYPGESPGAGSDFDHRVVGSGLSEVRDSPAVGRVGEEVLSQRFFGSNRFSQLRSMLA